MTIKSAIDKVTFCFIQPDELQQHQINSDDRGTEEHQGDKLEDCCCQCTGHSLLTAMNVKKKKQVPKSFKRHLH